MREDYAYSGKIAMDEAVVVNAFEAASYVQQLELRWFDKGR